MHQIIKIIFFTLSCSYNLTAQSDCISAAVFCVDDRFEVFQESSSGTVLESLGEVCDVSPFSIDTETNAYWIRYEFASDGNFTFTITPGSDDVDIDFYVFQSPDDDCTELNSLRCMLTGENSGSDTDPSCLGPTGLSLGSVDVLETPGCQAGDDNFLAALEVKGGDVYYLLIRSFNPNGMDDFSIEHGGSAERGCAVTSTTKEDSKASDDIIVSPNPFIDIVNIQFLNSFSDSRNIQIFDMYGHLVSKKTRLRQGELDLSYLPSGIYFLHITNNKEDESVHKIIKL